MKGSENIIRAKLKNCSGFTLAEQLVSVVFLGLIMLAIGAGLGAALSVSNKANLITAADQLMTRSVQEINDELIFSIEVEPGGQFLSASTRTIVGFSNEYDGLGAPLGIALVGEGVGGQGVDSVMLIPATDDLLPSISALTYNETNNTWSYTIKIASKGSSAFEVIREQTMTVARNSSAGV